MDDHEYPGSTAPSPKSLAGHARAGQQAVHPVGSLHAARLSFFAVVDGHPQRLELDAEDTTRGPLVQTATTANR
jgi:hypothetical protein